jgi:UDP-sulfoquinovose synthase
MATIMVLGGDGFCGWPTALHLSKLGFDVVIVDNLSRRKIDVELEVESLTPISPMGTRLAAWEEITGKRISHENLTVGQDYHQLTQLLKAVEPEAIVHFAEQRAAPYSMKSTREKRYTVNNNLNATHDVLCAMVDSGVNAHLVHLGTIMDTEQPG